MEILTSMNALKWCGLSTLSLVMLISSCVQYEDVSPVPSKRFTPKELSTFIPTSTLTVEPSEFERMLDSPSVDIEIPGIFSLYRDGKPVCEDELVELQIKGTYSSFLPAKAFGIKFDKSLRNNDGDFLRVPYRREEHTFNRIKSFRLRNGGGAFKTTLLKDLAYARMVTASSLDVLPLYGEPAATYINGSFYSLHNLRTENNKNGVSRVLGINEDRLSIASVDGDLPMEIKAGREEFWRDFEHLVEHATTEELLARIDQRSFADFLITGSIFATSDWPYRNVRMYSIDEGAIRFMVYDFDASGEDYANRSPYDFLVKGRSSIVRKLFKRCYQDAKFAQRIEQRYDEVRQSGELSHERLRAHLLGLANVYEPVIEEQIYRWGFPTSVAAWYADLEALVGDYTLRYSKLPENFR